MEINSRNQEKIGDFTKWWSKVKDIPRKFKKKVGKIVKNIKEIGEDDPRKICHAFKVGLALTLVSLFYYNEPLFHSFDEPVMWAILTVLVTFEFIVGGTISKCINKGIATTLADAFGLGAKYLAELIGKKEPSPIVLGVLVFIASIEFKSRTEEACKRMITESSKALKELALPIRTMTQLISSIIHRRNTENIIDDLKHILGTSKIFFPHDESRVMDFIDATSIVSLLVAITTCVDEIAKAIEELLDTWRHHNRNSGRDKKHQKRKENL
ncbi:Aluminum-activated malate transporter 8 [Capsicum chinense]|nr:Aluminum-activated malate transporter 8 [Capsicum chinense]